MTVPQRWQRLCFSAQLSNCNLATCWHIELSSILGLGQLSISIHLRISFSFSVRFFQSKITLGLALGESWLLLAQPPKNTDVHKGMLPWEGLPRQTCINHILIKFRLLYDDSFAPALGGAFAMGTNTMALIQTCQIQAIMTVPQGLSFSAQLSNCNLVTCWRTELSILGLVHLSIRIHLRISFSCCMKCSQRRA